MTETKQAKQRAPDRKLSGAFLYVLKLLRFTESVCMLATNVGPSPLFDRDADQFTMRNLWSALRGKLRIRACERLVKSQCLDVAAELA